MLSLNPAETRVLGCLMEKETTTPEYYPLSLNALVNACNQKSSRDPVMDLNEAEVRSALFELEGQGLVRTLADARVTKFEHRMWDRLNLRRDEVAVMCLLLLRGAQTPAELRARAERLYAFDDAAAVTTTLARLAAREEPLTRLLERQPGAREARWVHLLGRPDEESSDSTAGDRDPIAEPVESAPEFKAGLRSALERIEALEHAMRLIENRLTALEGQTSGPKPFSSGDELQ